MAAADANGNRGITLLDGAAEDTTGAGVELGRSQQGHYKGVHTVYVWGTFGGTTVTIEISPDAGTTWFSPDNNDFTAAGVQNIEFYGDEIRAVTTGGSSASINVRVF